MGRDRPLERATRNVHDGLGDCEDYAIAKYVALTQRRVSRRKM